MTDHFESSRYLESIAVLAEQHDGMSFKGYLQRTRPRRSRAHVKTWYRAIDARGLRSNNASVAWPCAIVGCRLTPEVIASRSHIRVAPIGIEDRSELAEH